MSKNLKNPDGIPLFKEALDFGFSPIPIKGKAPITSQWSTKPKFSFIAALENHRGNIGIRTGLQSGIVVLDCDLARKNTKGTNGNKDFSDMYFKETGKTDPLKMDTVIDQSGSGSHRFYFKLDVRKDMATGENEILYNSGIKGMNIDVLAAGKQCVYPGSIYPGCCPPGKKVNKHKCETNDWDECLFKGNKYKWIHSPAQYKLAEIPLWLRKYIINDDKSDPKVEEEYTRYFETPENDEDELPENEKKVDMLNHLTLDRWCDFDEWRDTVWLACKLGLTEDQIHILSEKAGDQYDETATSKLIRQFNPEKNEMTIGSLYHKLKTDDSEYYKTVIVENFKKLEKERKKTLEKAIPLEDISPNEVIDSNDIGPYGERLLKHDVVCVRSNMMTYKTQRVKDEIRANPKAKVLIVSFRTSLDEAYIEEFKEFNFSLYSDEKGAICKNRLVCQIDSLSRLRGSFDLIFFDEIESTTDHLCSFVKRKPEVWDTLCQYIKETPKIITADALLSKGTIKLFKDLGRTTHVVDNKWMSFKGQKATFIRMSMDNFDYINYLSESLSEKKRVISPCTSKIMADKAYSYLTEKFPDKKIGIVTSDTELIPVSDWGKYDCFIYTPTIVAGISFNDEHFSERVAYFTDKSCSANSACQMLFRARNTPLPMKIFLNTNKGYLPVTDRALAWHIRNEDRVSNLALRGLKMDNIRGEIKKDEYYRLYLAFRKKENMSRNNFPGVLRGILEAHGIECELKPNDFDKSDDDSRKRKLYLSDSDECAKLTKEKGEKTLIDISESPVISKEEAHCIKQKHRKTKSEKNLLRKYYMSETYSDVNTGEKDFITPKFIKKYEKLIPQFRNLEEMNRTDFNEYVRNNIKLENECFNSKTKNANRLHVKNKTLKMYVANKIVEMLGFNNIWDDKTIDGYDHNEGKKYLIANGNLISALFGSKTYNWKKIDISTVDGKKIVSTFLNTKLKSVCALTVKKVNRKKTCNNYKISGLEIWEKGSLRLRTVQEKINQEKHISLLRNSKKEVISEVIYEDRFFIEGMAN